MAPALPRPRQVTIAGWVIMAGSAAVVLTVFQQIAGLHTLDTREAVAQALAEPPFDELGVTVEEVLAVVRVLAMVAAACATATAILGWQVLQRSKAARIALSILALPLFLTGIGTGGVMSSVVAAAVVVLWLQPARDWFAGRWRPEPEQPRAAARDTREAPVAPPAEQEPPAAPQPPPYVGWPAAPQAGWPPPAGYPAPGHPAPGAPAGTPPAGPPAGPAGGLRRPAAVVTAAVVTWVCSLLLGGLFVIGAAWLVGRPESLMDELTRQNPELVRDGRVTVEMLRGMLVVMTGLIIVWVGVASVAAAFALRGAAWARVVLLVSSGTAGVALLLGSFVNPVMIVPLAGAAWVVALLLRRDVAGWFRAASRR